MEKDIFIFGVLHKCFTQGNYIPDNDTIHHFANYFPARHYFIAAFSMPEANSTDSIHARLIPSIPTYVAEQADFPVWYYRTEDNRHLLFINHDNSDDVIKFVENIHCYFNERYDFVNYWGISRACSSLSELLFAKKEAITALDIAKQSTDSHITCYDTTTQFLNQTNNDYFYPDVLKQMLMYAIKNMDYTLLDFVLTILYDENIRLAERYEGLLQLNFCIIDTLQIFHSPKHPISDKLLIFSQNAVIYQNSPEEYFHALLRLCKEISEQINTQKNHQKNAMIVDIQNYIRENFSDATLNLSSISEHFERSEGYLSSLFKETAGVSFSEYLEKCRIEKSCELLVRSDKPVADIALLTGYNSVYSFRRAFKRTLNVSPKDYRLKNRQTKI